MTDDDWFVTSSFRITTLLAEADPGERQHWLFAARCLARTLDWVAHPLLPDIIAVCFRLADRPGDDRLLTALENLRLDILPEGWLEDVPREFVHLDGAVRTLLDVEAEPYQFVYSCAATLPWCPCECEGFDAEEFFQLDILRDLVPPPSALPWDARWETETVLLLSSLVESRAEFSLSPVFADALEDAGCGCAARLAHLRSESASHGPGCWALAPGRRASSAATPPTPRANPLFCD